MEDLGEKFSQTYAEKMQGVLEKIAKFKIIKEDETEEQI